MCLSGGILAEIVTCGINKPNVLHGRRQVRS